MFHVQTSLNALSATNSILILVLYVILDIILMIEESVSHVIQLALTALLKNTVLPVHQDILSIEISLIVYVGNVKVPALLANSYLHPVLLVSITLLVRVGSVLVIIISTLHSLCMLLLILFLMIPIKLHLDCLNY